MRTAGGCLALAVEVSTERPQIHPNAASAWNNKTAIGFAQIADTTANAASR